MFVRTWLVAGMTALCVAATADAGDELPGFRQFADTYCVHCHSQDDPSGHFDLTGILSSVSGHPERWETVLRRLKTRQMPPAEADRPDEDTYQSVQRRLESQLDAYAVQHPNPGRTETFRRLTRFEYQNAIRDLLALRINAADMLPKDEVSHGFDNITVGELSPSLISRYVTAAQRISRLAVGTAGGHSFAVTERVRPDLTQESHLAGLPYGTRGGTIIRQTFPADGSYRITARLMRDRNEHVEGLHEPHEMEFLLDGRRIALLPIRPPRKAVEHATCDQHLETRVDITAGPHEVGVTFIAKPRSLIETRRQPWQARINYHRSPRQTPALYEVSVTAEQLDSAVRETPSRRRIFGVSGKDAASPEARAEEILTALLRRAYRRPVDANDLAQPMKFWRQAAQHEGFDAGIQEALAAILVNPNFLFRIERDPPEAAAKTPYRISDIELASRLSFFLWSSLPDDSLLQLAEQNRLHEDAVIRQQVERMLRDPRSASLVSSFAGQWLYLRNLESLNPDGRLYPDFDHNLREAFRKETELVFERILRQDRSVLDLLKSQSTFLNERLAKHYDIPHVYGDRFREVLLPAGSRRGGLLRHASVLSVTSYATRTSPVIRGHWILENLLGTPPPPPPGNVPALKDNSVDANLTIRERLAAHRADAACASCHNLMDPVGFALENYDAIGRWRTLDREAPVDASGGLPDGSVFVGPDGLEAGLLERPDVFVGTMTEKLLTYALGRGVKWYDAATVRNIVRHAAENDYRFSELIRGIVLSPAFQMRMTP